MKNRQKLKVINSFMTVDNKADISDTALYSYIRISYQTLKSIFGKHKSFPKYSKLDAEWVIVTPYGVATIYNYKDGKNYNGKDGTPLKNITDWHIGCIHDQKGMMAGLAVFCFLLGIKHNQHATKQKNF